MIEEKECMWCKRMCAWNKDFDSKTERYVCSNCGEYEVSHQYKRNQRDLSQQETKKVADFLRLHQNAGLCRIISTNSINDAEPVPDVDGVYVCVERID